MKDAEMIARETGQIAYEAAVKNVNYAPPFSSVHGMERTVWEDIEKAVFRAGYEAAREQAAGIADAETGKTPHGNYDYGPNVAHRLRAAIRSMEPDDA